MNKFSISQVKVNDHGLITGTELHAHCNGGFLSSDIWGRVSRHSVEAFTAASNSGAVPGPLTRSGDGQTSTFPKHTLHLMKKLQNIICLYSE